MWAYLLFLVLLVVVCAVLVMLMRWVDTRIKPRLSRWVWHKLGGEGDPPAWR